MHIEFLAILISKLLSVIIHWGSMQDATQVRGSHAQFTRTRVPMN